MKRIFTLSNATLILALLIAAASVAQSGTARIKITKKENGNTSTESMEVPIEDGQDIEAILKEIGVLDEFGQLKEGQSFEIDIRRFDEGDETRDINMDISVPTPPDFMWEMPQMEDRAFLGVMLKETTDANGEQVENSGVMISEVIENTAAEKAGLEAGDVIVELDNTMIQNVTQAVEYIQSKEVGDKVQIEVLRDGNKKKMNATLGERQQEDYMFYRNEMAAPGALDELPALEEFDLLFDPDSITILCPDNMRIYCDSMRICQPFSWNGTQGFELKETAFLGVTPANDEGSGVPIYVVEGSSAEEMGLENEDVITEFNGTAVDTFDQLAAEIEKTAPGTSVDIVYLHQGKEKKATGELGKREMSGCDEFRIFHDYKGMDEEGNYFYEYEFDMNEEDLEQNMEEMMEQLQEQELALQMEQDRVRQQLDDLRSRQKEIHLSITIDDISPEEAQRVNQNASPQLELKNDLELNSISFFPNPSDGLVNLNFTLSTTGDLHVVLYDMNGNKVYIEELDDFTGAYSKMIDISEHSNGTYYLQVSQNGHSYSKKLVKGE